MTGGTLAFAAAIAVLAAAGIAFLRGRLTRRRVLTLVAAGWLVAGAAIGRSTDTEPGVELPRLVMVVDRSQSMHVADGDPSRAATALAIVHDAVHRHDQETAVVVVGDTAAVVRPLARGSQSMQRSPRNSAASNWSLRAAFDDAGVGPGSNLAAGLEEAVSLLDRSRRSPAAIVVLTDGEDHAAEAVSSETATQLERWSVAVLLIGTRRGGLVPDSDGEPLQYDGEPVRSRVQREWADRSSLPVLEVVSSQSAGRAAVRDWWRAEVAAAPPPPLSPSLVAAKTFAGLAVVLLAVAMFVRSSSPRPARVRRSPTRTVSPSSVSPSRRQVAAVGLLAALLMATEPGESSANRSGRAALQAGIDAMHEANWEAAATHFATAESSRWGDLAAFNRGCALIKLAEETASRAPLRDAVAAFGRASARQPSWLEARQHLAATYRLWKQSGGGETSSDHTPGSESSQHDAPSRRERDDSNDAPPRESGGSSEADPAADPTPTAEAAPQMSPADDSATNASPARSGRGTVAAPQTRPW